MKYLLLGAFIFVSVYAIALKYDKDVSLINKKIYSLADKSGYEWEDGHMTESQWVLPFIGELSIQSIQHPYYGTGISGSKRSE